jgi:hypothetical protein
LNAWIIQTNRPQRGKQSLFLTEGGQFRTKHPAIPGILCAEPQLCATQTPRSGATHGDAGASSESGCLFPGVHRPRLGPWTL